jgi:hypothetical protein
MAPQRHGNGLPPWMTEDDDNDNEDVSQPSTTLFEVPVETSVEIDADAPVLVLVEDHFYPATTMPQYPPVPTAPPSNIPDHFSKARPRPYDWSSTISTSTTSSESSQQPTTTTLSKSSLAVATADVTQTTSIDANGFPDGWRNRGQDYHSQAPIYAAAALVPVAVLAIIGAIVFVCLRRRKRRRLEAATAAANVREMKAHSKPTIEPYMAPSSLPSAVLPNYYPPVSSRPIILGPIPSGTNGAYLTGIDTSDMVSVISANQFRTSMADPLADGRSLEEPPPPYRPRSMAPSSIGSTSRHSSVRVAAHPPDTSQTHLIERSPFDDPEDDNISELSGFTIRRETDAASAVSDLSYQLDPVVGRTSL